MYRLAIAIPIIYFGVQLIAAPFFPGYSFLDQDASTLGSDSSNAPWIFNIGAILCGIVMLIAARGFPMLAAIVLVCGGVGMINAGIFPTPDPRHSSGPLAIVGLGQLLLPLALPLVVWKTASEPLKAYLVTNLIAFVALIPVMSGLAQRLLVVSGAESSAYQAFLNDYHGLLQRGAAALLFVPVGVVAYSLAKRHDANDRSES